MYKLDLSPSGAGGRVAGFHDMQPDGDDFGRAVRDGLSGAEKALPCRFLYDEAGSALFDKICDLPEYYPTRTELSILRTHAGDIAQAVGLHAQVIELGSGSSTKIRILLDAVERPAAYVPIDISGEHLRAAAQRIQDDYPNLRVDAIRADYATAFELPPAGAGRRVGFYPGSTIGNLTPDQATQFLQLWADRLGEGAALLIGVDLRKDRAILEPAYDDSQGVTAAFSLNLLARANRELGADFNLRQFRHEAAYKVAEGRIAIHLRSLSDQSVHIGDDTFAFAEGEPIHIEDSWKYSIEGFGDLAWAAGFEPRQCWVDDANLFSLHLLDVRTKAKL